MKKLTKYHGRIRRMALGAITATCFACLLYVPMSINNETEAVGCYKVIMDGQEIGFVNSPEDAKEAYFNARKQLAFDNNDIVYANMNYEVVEDVKTFGTRFSVADMQQVMYNTLSANVVDMNANDAYTVRINDFTVTVASKNDVLELIDKVKKSYDGKNEFQVAIVAEKNSEIYSVELSKSGFAGLDKELVAMSQTGTSVSEGSSFDEDYGVSDISFCQDISIVATKASSKNILSVEEAYAQVTKTTAAKTYYTVVGGDCISAIARKNNITMDELFALNPGMNINSLILPGDEIVVTVPKPELSVQMTERVTVEESYYAPVVYRDNNSLYIGNNRQISAAVPGTREIIADVTYVDGIETSRTIVEEHITKEAVAQVVERGTLVPPTYIKPVAYGSVSWTFGWHDGTFHKGNDWYVPTGTPIMACASGTVIRASWYNGYGNCIEVRHDNGVVTRYAHLSGYNCGVGQRVGQGQVIGYSGATGNVTGPHIHLEFIVNGNFADPLSYVSR